MNRRSTDRANLARRLGQVRLECYGPEGIEELAALLDLPPKTWQNYESGVTIPGLDLLQFIQRTRAHPTWLLTGAGDRFQGGPHPSPRPDGATDPVIRLTSAGPRKT